jgi:hypothetical protein
LIYNSREETQVSKTIPSRLRLSFRASRSISFFGDNRKIIRRGFCCSHLHDLILELGQEVVDDLVLLDGQRVKVDLLHAVDLAGLDAAGDSYPRG